MVRTTAVLNYMHNLGFRSLLARVSQAVYFMKGFGFVRAVYHPKFRAYEYTVAGTTFLSLGPGWAYSFNYLKSLLIQTYSFEYLPNAGDCVIDIGAGLGEETVIYSILVGNKGKVFALEANPTTFSGLEYMCRKNNFKSTIPLNLAIYHTVTEVTIEDDDENYLTNTINVASPNKSTIKVQAISLDALVRDYGIPQIDFLKANIEGAEQYLIEGMADSIKIVRNVCISCHDFRHNFHAHGEFYMTKDKVISFLRSHGFEITMRTTGNRVIDDYVYGVNRSMK